MKTNFSGQERLDIVKVTDELLGPVLKNNPKLNELDLSHSIRCSSAVFQILTVNCPQITKLVLRNCPWVDQNSLSYFYNHYSVRKPGQQLEDVLLNMSKGLRTNLKAKNIGAWISCLRL